MIDFENAEYLKLRPVKEEAFDSLIGPMLVSGEEVVQCFQTVRDGVVFTNRRIIAINIQGLTGKKKAFTTLPYSRAQAFSVETSGVLDMDSELSLWYSGLGKIRFEFVSNADVAAICRTISQQVL